MCVRVGSKDMKSEYKNIAGKSYCSNIELLHIVKKLIGKIDRNVADRERMMWANLRNVLYLIFYTFYV